MKTNKLNIVCLLSILCLALSLVGCRKDGFVDETNTTAPDPTINMVVDINGIILDKNNEPIENVEIKVGDRVNSTDENGVFILRQATVNDAGTRLKAQKSGYFNQYRIVYPNKSKEKIYVQLEMIEKETPTKFLASTGDEISFNNGAKVSFPSNAIVDNLGNAYSGEVSVYAHWYDPTDVDLAINSPASLEGVNKLGEEVVLGTFGMVGVELESTSGEPLQIANDKKAELVFPIPTKILAEAPETIPLWSVDNSTGKWVEEFSATKVGNEYRGSVSHFSFWNCDFPYNLVNIEGYLKMTDGTPISNHTIQISLGSVSTGYGNTNNVGYFEGKVPKDALLTLAVISCGEIVLEMEIGPFSDDVDLGDLTADLLIASTNITATLKGCIGEPLSGAYGLIDGYQLLSAEDDGSIAGILTACTNSSHAIKFYDGTNMNVSDELVVDISISNNNYGDITVCEELGEYLSFSVDGGDYWLIENPDAYIVNGNRLALRASLTTTNVGFSTDVESIALGTHEPESTIAYLPPDAENPNGKYLYCQDGEDFNFKCDQFSVEILEIDLVTEMVSGTFEGYLKNNPDGPDGSTVDEELFVTGSFRSKITEQFDEASVSGKLWVDLNENGTRDFDEEDTAPLNITISRFSADGAIVFGNLHYYAHSGTYDFTGLRPGNYYLRIYTPQYELTDFQSGNPDFDNDFMEDVDSDNYISYTFNISSGEQLENIDLGFKPPSFVNCLIAGNGCEPDIDIYYTITGGLKPYNIEFSNGQMETVDGSGSINVMEGGTYSMTITDALNNTSTCENEILSYNNRVVGRVWQDNPSGTEGLYESGVDGSLIGTKVKLFDSSDQFIKEDIADNGGFYIDNIAPGDYYIQVETPSGYNISDLVDDDFDGNDIDPSTGKSLVINITECYSTNRVNAGFKPE